MGKSKTCRVETGYLGKLKKQHAIASSRSYGWCFCRKKGLCHKSYISFTCPWTAPTEPIRSFFIWSSAETEVDWMVPRHIPLQATHRRRRNSTPLEIGDWLSGFNVSQTSKTRAWLKNQLSQMVDMLWYVQCSPLDCHGRSIPGSCPGFTWILFNVIQFDPWLRMSQLMKMRQNLAACINVQLFDRRILSICTATLRGASPRTTKASCESEPTFNKQNIGKSKPKLVYFV